MNAQSESDQELKPIPSRAVSHQQYPETCPGCGARLRPGAEACDLCGQLVHVVHGAREVEEPVFDPAAETLSPDPVLQSSLPDAAGPYCNHCGWKNPANARFCSQCGSALQQLATRPVAATASIPAPPRPLTASPATDPPVDTPAGGDFRKMAVAITAAGVLLVVVLYAITAFSKKNFVAVSEPTPAPQETVAGGAATGTELVPPDLEAQAAAIRASADSLAGAERAARLAEVVNLYVGRGLFQHAAEAQADVAEAIGTAQAWSDVGNLSYRAMQVAEGPAKITFATAAIEAYTRSLEIDPDNLDVRTDMATAYLATNNPMEGVRQIRQVLDANPDHVQANFNYGVMLSMIGRTDQSIAQFERVRELVGPGSDTYRQAELALQELRGE